ncbi:glucosamine-6-phosphate deaminase [Akkermansiaceae bacterium]|nr:glucosamine-6-phosphate deaminase [Akkermansiaceae bacterium]MDA8968896.1 glucosamine-6-phosphate deaminase [Akkermansiaceae bacterium]MDB4271697.1 glucosamine-6-phosphate deaminase [Akkermansiaceae bacterium]MDB4412305.1 glucosamine-6-phosphate deaminase [Akkermansiaceae bacterium]MDB4667711.1 glucosamine-6-phosphate deaminase [Akkermansiaceae bacterium]
MSMVSGKIRGKANVRVGDKEALAREIVAEVDALIRLRASEGREVVLGLATGSSPLPIYAEMVRRHREEGLSFANVVSFNLDEYEGLEPSHPESYGHFMQEHLFGHVDMRREAIHMPDGNGDAEKIAADYEGKMEAAGGIDWQLLGIGRNGHIGFNEPGSSRESRTRRIELNEITRQDAAPAFGGIQNVPTHAVTMGVRSILAARQICLLAWGESKREIVHEAMSGKVTSALPATFLQDHASVKWYLDFAAAGP